MNSLDLLQEACARELQEVGLRIQRSWAAGAGSVWKPLPFCNKCLSRSVTARWLCDSTLRIEENRNSWHCSYCIPLRVRQRSNCSSPKGFDRTQPLLSCKCTSENPQQPPISMYVHANLIYPWQLNRLHLIPWSPLLWLLAFNPQQLGPKSQPHQTRWVIPMYWRASELHLTRLLYQS